MAIGRVFGGRIESIPAGKWETVNATLERIPVPGGWLYRSRLTTGCAPIAYVPDPEVRRPAREPPRPMEWA